MQSPVVQSGQAIAQAGLIVGIDIRDYNTRPARKPIKHYTPGIDNHRVTVGFPPVDVISTLSRRNDIGEIFNGAGANECLPMSSAGG